jgi:hypothetical protein
MLRSIYMSLYHKFLKVLRKLCEHALLKFPAGVVTDDADVRENTAVLYTALTENAVALSIRQMVLITSGSRRIVCNARTHFQKTHLKNMSVTVYFRYTYLCCLT